MEKEKKFFLLFMFFFQVKQRENNIITNQSLIELFKESSASASASSPPANDIPLLLQNILQNYTKYNLEDLNKISQIFLEKKDFPIDSIIINCFK